MKVNKVRKPEFIAVASIFIALSRLIWITHISNLSIDSNKSGVVPFNGHLSQLGKQSINQSFEDQEEEDGNVKKNSNRKMSTEK